MPTKPAPSEAQPLLSTEQVAGLLGVPAATVRYWKHTGDGPPCFKLGRHVRYSQEAVSAWLTAHRDGSRERV